MPSHHRHRSGKSRRTEPEEDEENDVVDPQLYAQYAQQEEYAQEEYEQEAYTFEGSQDDIYSAEDQPQEHYTSVELPADDCGLESIQGAMVHQWSAGSYYITDASQSNNTYTGNYDDYYAGMAGNSYTDAIYPGETAGESSSNTMPPNYCPVCEVLHEFPRDVKRCLRKIEKPIECEAENPCGHRTAQQKDMDRHYWTTHMNWADNNGVPNTMTHCPVCGDRLKRSDYLKKHMERRHPDGQHESKKDKDKKGKKHDKKK